MDQYDLEENDASGRDLTEQFVYPRGADGELYASGMGEQGLMNDTTTGAGATIYSSTEVGTCSISETQRQGIISSSKTKNKRPAKDFSPSSEDALSYETIQLALPWLEPQDLASATQVCKTWEDGISSDQYAWKNAGENIKPEAFRALEQATSRSSKLTSRAMAVGLAKVGKKNAPLPPPGPVSRPSLPGPTIKAEDIFVLVEIQAFGTSNAWCKKLSFSVDTFLCCTVVCAEWDEPSKVPYRVPEDRRKVDDDLSSSLGDLRVLTDNLRMTASFWRQDTGQSFRICADRSIDDYVDDDCFWYNCEDEIIQGANANMCVSMEKSDDGVYFVSRVLMEFRYHGLENSEDEVSQTEFLLSLEALHWE